MISINFSYGDKIFKLNPYTSAIEKELLILETLEYKDMSGVLQLLGLSVEESANLTESEQLAILFKYRCISVGDEIQIKFICKNCGQVNENILSVEDNIEESVPEIPVKQQYKELTRENLQDFLDIDVDELDLKEFEDIYEKTKRSVVKFNFVKETRCLKCGEIHRIDFGNIDKILTYMSEDSLAGIYQTYADMVFFGKYTKSDIDSMLPFERTIFMGLLNKTREELSK